MLRHPSDHTKYRTLTRQEISAVEPLLVEVLRKGQLVYELPTLEAIRAARLRDVEALDSGIRRLVNPHIYHVSLSEKLWQLKQELIEAARKDNMLVQAVFSAQDSTTRRKMSLSVMIPTTLLLRTTGKPLTWNSNMRSAAS